MSTIHELKFMPGAKVLVKMTGAKGTVLSGYYSEVKQVALYFVRTENGEKVNVLEEGLELQGEKT